jgi:hypothetical protein
VKGEKKEKEQKGQLITPGANNKQAIIEDP